MRNASWLLPLQSRYMRHAQHSSQSHFHLTKIKIKIKGHIHVTVIIAYKKPKTTYKKCTYENAIVKIQVVTAAR